MVRTRSEYLRISNNVPARTRAEFLRLYRELDCCVERISDLTRLISEAAELGRRIFSKRLAEKHEHIKEKKRLLLYEDNLHVKIWEFLGFSDNVGRLLPLNVREQLRNLITSDLATADEVGSFEDMLFRVIDESDDGPDESDDESFYCRTR